MGIFDFFFKKNKKDNRDPLNLNISTMKSGDFVDYDMKTWQVKKTGYYEWSANDITREWQLVSGNDVVYLEMESGDEESWSISRKINFSVLGDLVRNEINKKGDPPEKIMYDGSTFYLEISGGGFYYEEGNPLSSKLLKWDYADEKSERFLSIEQWGENEFEASEGISAEEYQFSNITPGNPSASF